MPFAAGISAAWRAGLLKPSPRLPNAPLSDNAREMSASGPSSSVRSMASAEPSAAPSATSGADAVLLRRGQPDPELETERLGDLVVPERAEALAGDAPHDFADEVAVGDRVVAVRGARLPVGLLHLDRVDDRIPGEHLFGGERRVDGGETRLVAQEPAHRDVLLARLPRTRASTSPPAHRRRARRAARGGCAHAAVAPLVVENTSCSESVV